MLFPYSCPWPPALSARYPLPALPSLVSRGFPRRWLRAGGGRSGQSPAVCRCCSALRNRCEPSGRAAAPRRRPAPLSRSARGTSAGLQEEIWLAKAQLKGNALHLSWEIARNKPCFQILNQVSPDDCFRAFAPSWKGIFAHLTLFTVNFYRWLLGMHEYLYSKS